MEVKIEIFVELTQTVYIRWFLYRQSQQGHFQRLECRSLNPLGQQIGYQS